MDNEQGINGPDSPGNTGLEFDDAVAAITPGTDGAAMAPAPDDQTDPADDQSGSN